MIFAADRPADDGDGQALNERTPRAAHAWRGLLCATALVSSACGLATPTPGGDAPASSLPPAGIAAEPPAAGAILPAAPASHCLPSHDGYLRLRMRGERDMDIDWHDADMLCDGGPRPGQQGIRVTFAGPGRRGESVRFVFGIAAAPGAQLAHNVPANVTVIFEGEHKLYSTAGDGKCTLDDFSEQPLPAPGAAHLQRINARGFCTEPARPLAGKRGLVLSRFDFVGALREEDTADAPLPSGR